MKTLIFGVAVGILVSGCANPLNRVTMDRYAQACVDAEHGGQLSVAEEACRRALINVRIGNLGLALESQTLYNLGRIKKQLGKYSEAEEYYKASLKIQESLPVPDQRKIGRRLAELSIVAAEQQRFAEAWPMVVRLMALSDNFSDDEKRTVGMIFNKYAEEYDALEMFAEAAQLRKKADALQFEK